MAWIKIKQRPIHHEPPRPMRARGPSLKLRVSSLSCEPFDIEPSGEELFVGRSSTCDLVIPHQGISRRHLRLFRRGQQWFIQDLGSTNASFLAQKKLDNEPVEIHNGNTIRLAPSKSDYTLTIIDLGESGLFSDPGGQTVTQLASSLLDEMNAPLDHTGADVLRNHAQRLVQLSQANSKLSRARDRRDLAERLLDQLFTFIEADAAVIYLLGEDETFHLIASRPDYNVPPLSKTLLQEVTGSSMALYANDLSAHQALANSHSLAGTNLHAIVASPLFEEKNIYGIAAAYSYQMSKSFDESHMKLLVGLAAAASMRLHNIILTEKAAHQLQETNRRLEVMVAERTRELHQKTQQLISSMDYARHIQEAILPRPGRLAEVFSEAFVINMPRDIVSGDFYWCGCQGDWVMVALVDCTGHGVPGAFMSMIGYTLLNKIINEQKVTDPAGVLENLNQEVRKALKQEDTSIRAADGMEMGLVRVNPQTRELVFAGARFDLYTVRPGEKLRELKGNRQSIGGKQRRAFTGFVNQTVKLGLDERVFLFTDGFVDQPNLDKKRFGSPALKRLLEELSGKGMSMNSIHRALLDALSNHCGEVKQRDDISALGFTMMEPTIT